jgi:hypothetical protein
LGFWQYRGLRYYGLYFNQTVSGYVAITLAWDRRVELTDPDNSYSFGDAFFQYNDVSEILNNLDILLLNDLGQVVASSTTTEDNLEHIFFEVPAGHYEIRIEHNGGLSDAQDYALAWWAGEATLGGDFNGSGATNGRDFLEWQRGNSPDPFSSGDLGDWQANYGAGALTATNTAVPEPSSIILASILMLSLMTIRKTANTR